MTSNDPGYAVRHGDRREAPRRVEEVRLHYAEVGLLAAALALVECASDVVKPFSALVRAAATYRAAEAEAVAARSSHADR